MDVLSGIVREALVLVAILCLPVLAVATVVGTCVAIAQAATQVQEQTLTLLPKVLAVGALVAFGGGFAMRLCGTLFAETVRALPQIVRAGT